MKKNKINKKNIKWLLLIIIIWVLIFAASGGSDNTTDSSKDSTNISNTESIETEILSEEEKTIVTDDFITNSKGKDFFEKICNLNGIGIIEPTEMADSWNYENSNENSNFQVNSDKTTDEIYYIKIMTLTNTNIDDFLNACELEYEKNNIEKAKEWVKNNINKKASTTIGNLHFELNNPLNRPILEIYTKNGKDYESKQESKSLE